MPSTTILLRYFTLFAAAWILVMAWKVYPQFKDTLRVDGRVVAISRRELDALEILVRRADQVVPKRVLEDTIYGLSNDVTSNTIEALVSRLRRRLEAMHAGVSIHTLRGIGYLLKE